MKAKRLFSNLQGTFEPQISPEGQVKRIGKVSEELGQDGRG